MKKITVVFDKKGMQVDFENFRGSTCYREHEKLTKLLAEFGIEEKITQLQQKEEAQAQTKVKKYAEEKD